MVSPLGPARSPLFSERRHHSRRPFASTFRKVGDGFSGADPRLRRRPLGRRTRTPVTSVADPPARHTTAWRAAGTSHAYGHVGYCRGPVTLSLRNMGRASRRAAPSASRRFFPKWFYGGRQQRETSISTTGRRPPEVWGRRWQAGTQIRACAP